MVSHSSARSAYAPSKAAIQTPRGIEYSAFVMVTSALKLHKNKSGRSLSELASALYQNRKLWTLLAMHVAEGSNALSNELRAQIYYLAEFTQLHSRKVLQNQASLDPLIEINTSVMRGLEDRVT